MTEEQQYLDNQNRVAALDFALRTQSQLNAEDVLKTARAYYDFIKGVAQ